MNYIGYKMNKHCFNKFNKIIQNSFGLDSFLYKKDKKLMKAIILAAGNGLRMIPINNNIPKALLNVKGEILIERIIKQLHEKNITEIYIVVGFMKEEFEYLIDKFGVKLLVNKEYGDKNNLHSLFVAKDYISNSYIIPCDLYFKENPFSEIELQSWYMVTEKISKHSNVTLNSKNELIKSKRNCQKMVGLTFINEEDGKEIKKRLEIFDDIEKYYHSYWEEILFNKNKMIIYGRKYNNNKVYEINTFEDLRNIDSISSSLENESINLIADIFKTDIHNIKNISYLKKGMTNRSFLFEYNNNRYIMRVPGEGTDLLINRKEEYEVYKKIKSLNICDDIIYMNPATGYKITKFIYNVRTCNIHNIKDLSSCMKFLKKFHNQKIIVNHYFDLFEKIEFYETLRGEKSLYHDYDETKQKVYDLKDIIKRSPKTIVLTHIDAVPDNFLIYEENGKEKIRLIDWEYASMQDPHVDIVMFCIHALYDRKNVDQLIDIYFENKCTVDTRIKIYCYIAVCGLLWSNWCEYKYTLGVEFGEYSLAQYRYAKDYYKIVQEELKKRDNICTE